MRILIIGAGIMGLATARALHLAGHTPVLLERRSVPNPLGSSVDHHRAIRVTYGPMHGYAAMVLEAYGAWDRLWADLGVSHYVETGQLVLGQPGDSWIGSTIQSLDLLDQEYEFLGETALATRFPMIRPGSRALAMHVPRAGALLAERIVRDLAGWLRRREVALHEHAEVTSIDPERASATLADGRILEGDVLVITAGTWVGRLLPHLADRLVPSRQVVVYRRAPGYMREAWAKGPMLVDSADQPGNVFYALPAVGGTDLKWGDHRFSRDGDIEGDRMATAKEIAEVVHAASRCLVDAEAYAPIEAKSCFYTVTADERFHAEQLGKAYVISACSGHGFKFGALIGERAASAVTGETCFASFADWLAGREMRRT